MSALPDTALVVGGGIAGMSAAMRLMDAGAAVTLIDKDPEWSVYGAGITCSALTFRALCDLGLANELLSMGAPHNVVALHDLAGGSLLRTIPLPRLQGETMDAGGGIMRPDLHAIMSARVRSLGAEVRLGLTVDAVSQDADGVDVTFRDGTTGRFDLVVGADGLFSTMRDMVLPNAPKPKFTGQACWRVMFDLPQEWQGVGAMFLSPTLKVGFTPCAPGRMYMYLLEHVPDNPWRDASEMPGILRNLLKDAGGKVAEFRDVIGADTPINYRPVESVLVDGDWYNGRVVLIGDTVHATTPHLASGAGMAVEDAIVLVEELGRHDTQPDAFRAFMDRRLERAKMVVGNSLKLGELEMAGAPMQQQAALMQASTEASCALY
ncbi:FAD-dependent monooxygenase [Hoeflea sp.]|uniref:FAD-dependent monooxygenase n=1 Tax=Hoeflea sp. TaxID=1940281 RepID=UPI0025BDB2AF|nr:FAD-dependent monooxygenase [Hoeflea sp.]